MARGAPRSVQKAMRTPTPPGKKKPGLPKGRKKTGGKLKGSKNKSTILKEQALEAAMNAMWGHLTLEEKSRIPPLRVFEMIQAVAFEANQMALAATMAHSAAPYKHARLAPKDDGDGGAKDEVKVQGGFPVD